MTDLASAFFSISISEESQLHFAFLWEGSQFTFTGLPQGDLNLPAVVTTWSGGVWT